jgi:hypothetical protein
MTTMWHLRQYSGEPCDWKRSRTVRWGAYGKVPRRRKLARCLPYTFALNCLLNREYAENGVPFDMLEPMGHGKHLADAFGLPWYVLSAQATCLNPQDVMFPTLLEQTSHTIRIYETVLGRSLSGGQRENLERGLLAQALEVVYSAYRDNLEELAPDKTPTADFVCDVLSGLGKKPHIQQIAKDLADEIAALVTGSGPWAKFLNGTTTFDFGRSGRDWIEQIGRAHV